MMKILVTGGLGFVGINLVRYLAQTFGCEVIAADVSELSPAMAKFLQPVRNLVRWLPLDVRDRTAFRYLVDAEGVTHIVHAAAITPDLAQERSQAPFVVDVNLGGAVNAMAIGFEKPLVERVLICSSSGVYGAPEPAADDLPQTENGPLQLDNLYAITKYSAEMVAARCAQLGPTMMASVRLGSVYGPFEQPTGSRQRVSQVQRLCNAFREGRKIKLAGQQITRDWVYTVDVAEAVRALLCAPRWNYPVYNIGSGVTASFEQVALPFVKRGLSVEWVDDPAQADIAMTSASKRAALDISRLQADTQFIPRYDMESGVADFVNLE